MSLKSKTININHQFQPESVDYMEKTDLSHRKQFGQYFTPKSIRETLINLLPRNIDRPKILDPACGTGEFLITAANYFKNPILEGWEIDKNLAKISQKIIPQAKILNLDSLKYQTDKKFDFIIGNPPYFEYSPDRETKTKYKSILNGRPNIFALFIKLGIDLLKDNGYLAFVVPPSMNNGAYFAKLRQYIVDHTNIENIKILDTDLFHQAQQLTMIMVLKKTKNNGNFIFKHHNIQIFSPDWQYLQQSFLGKTTLFDLGYQVKTGRVVWNQNKDKLTNDFTKSLLIWSTNIGPDQKLILNNKSHRPQYINLQNPDIGPALVVNRITGASKSAKIKVAHISQNTKFFAENHCNVIFPPKTKSKISLKDVIFQLSLPSKLEIIKSITGNTQISKNELEKLFPIDITPSKKPAHKKHLILHHL